MTIKRVSERGPSSKTAARGSRRARHTRAALEACRALDQLRETPANAAAVDLLADLLGAWTRRMITMNPTAAGRVYRALLDAWEDNREAGGGYDCTDPREHETGAYHTATRNRLLELFPTLGGARLDANQFDHARSAELVAFMRPEVAGMLARVEQAAAPFGETAPALAAIDADPWDELGEAFEDFMDEMGEGSEGD